MKTFAFHVNPHQRVVPAGEDFSNQVDRMTCLRLSQPLFQPLLSLPNGLMNNVVGTAATRDLKCSLPITKVNLAMAATKRVICEQQVGPTMIPQCDTIPPG